MKLALRLSFLIALGLVCAWAQKTGTTTGTTGTTTGTTTGLPTTTPAPATTTVTQPTRSIYLSGMVVTDDGSPLPGSANIQSVCGSQKRIIAHTSSSGQFGFQWAGNTAGMFEDASESSRGAVGNLGSSSSSSGSSGTGGSMGAANRSIDPLAGCDLQADLAGYTSSRLSLFNHQAFDSFDVGSIVLHRIGGDEGRVVSLLSLRAPKDAKKSFDKGTEQARANKPADAAASFEKAVAAYPQYADAWYSLGMAETQLGAPEAARTDFQKAMDLDDKLAGPWQELGYLASDQQKWEEAVRYLNHAVRLDPIGSPKAWYFNAVANYNLGKFDLAERSVRAELKLEPKNPHGTYLLGMVLIARKDLQGGMELLRTYLASAPQSAEADSARKQLARVETQLAH